MVQADMNLVAVLIAAIVQMIVGAVWYSPALFAKQWMALIGKSAEDLKNSSSSTGYAIASFASIVTAYILAKFIGFAQAKTAMDGLQIGLWAWIGFTATSTITTNAFSGNSWKLWVINYGYFLVTFSLMGMILALWQ
ncbi:MAG: DUF1761 domain-containing protein [bacterium]|nr:DUF1761 domain-containing protein [bacterium]